MTCRFAGGLGLSAPEGDGGGRRAGGGYRGGGCRSDDEAVRERDPRGVKQGVPELGVETHGGVCRLAEGALGRGRRRGADASGKLGTERGAVDRGSEAAQERDAERAAELGGGF
jgi:hypothetical protein